MEKKIHRYLDAMRPTTGIKVCQSKEAERNVPDSEKRNYTKMKGNCRKKEVIKMCLSMRERFSMFVCRSNTDYCTV